MAARRITISCPGCRNQFKSILIDEAERILFNGCSGCREGIAAKRAAAKGGAGEPAPSG